MTDPRTDKVAQLRIAPEAKQRSQGTLWTIFLVVAALALGAVAVWRPWQKETTRVVAGSASPKSQTKPADTQSKPGTTPGTTPAQPTSPTAPATPAASTATSPDAVALTVSGYIINRERIELSPRFMGQVRWIGVKKGDAVTNGQVVVLLDDVEYQAQKRELEGRLDAAKVQVARTELELTRVRQLTEARIETQRALDLAQLDLAAAQAEVKALDGQVARVNTFLDWTVIRSPINGVVLEKLVDPSELVTPQSFGGTRGPSTALMSVGDLNDLQVEIDLNEADLSKVFLGQNCRVTPEAYLDRSYQGRVAEIAPEASRQKGTLQIKVQILQPDRFLTPELSAKVDFLGTRPVASPTPASASASDGK
ncbi:MAG: efflux RND transporter periplasmic adaptor subunit [Verrucomicrobiales bacterium]|nr:efflux RND transporter periplasmic adaptor subunit [Verrucomicrobiales bacterium]